MEWITVRMQEKEIGNELLEKAEHKEDGFPRVGVRDGGGES